HPHERRVRPRRRTGHVLPHRRPAPPRGDRRGGLVPRTAGTDRRGGGPVRPVHRRVLGRLVPPRAVRVLQTSRGARRGGSAVTSTARVIGPVTGTDTDTGSQLSECGPENSPTPAGRALPWAPGAPSGADHRRRKGPACPTTAATHVTWSSSCSTCSDSTRSSSATSPPNSTVRPSGRCCARPQPWPRGRSPRRSPPPTATRPPSTPRPTR